MMTDEPLRPLTERQRQVADAIGRGDSYRKIARDLGISRTTVESHVTAILLLLPHRDALAPQKRILIWVRSAGR